MLKQPSTYLQQFRCGCFLEFARKKDVPRWCPEHLRDRQGEPLRVPEPGSNETTASFDRKAARVVVQLARGVHVSLPLGVIQGLAGAVASELAAIEVIHAGDGDTCLRWPSIGVEVNLRALLVGQLGGEQSPAAQLGAAGGRARSSTKAASSRENGRKGGRPRAKNVTSKSDSSVPG